MGIPATSMKRHMTGSDGAITGGVSASASRPSSSAKRLPRRCDGARVPIQMPPSSEPQEKLASAKPPLAREPCASAKAGISTSTIPKAVPIASDDSITVRRPAEPSAPARDDAWGEGGTARTAGANANHTVPLPASTAAATTATHGAARATSRATSSGPVMKNTSCTQASNAYAVSRMASPATRLGQSARMHAPIGAIVRPLSAAQAISAPSGARRVAHTASATSATGYANASQRSTRACPVRSTMRPHSGQPIAEASEVAAATIPAAAYERPSPRTSSTVASGAMPPGSRASSAAAAMRGMPGAPRTSP